MAAASPGSSSGAKVTLASPGVLSAELSAGITAFSATLRLFDSSGKFLTSEIGTAGSYPTLVSGRLAAGTYYVVAASQDLPGGYSIGYSLTPKTLAPCKVAPAIAVNTGYIGQLGPASCETASGQVGIASSETHQNT